MTAKFPVMKMKIKAKLSARNGVFRGVGAASARLTAAIASCIYSIQS
jgi:hypothetical protein